MSEIATTVIAWDEGHDFYGLDVAAVARSVFGVRRNGNVAYVNWSIDQSLRLYLEEVYPGIQFRAGPLKHSHPKLAIDRKLAEQIAYLLLDTLRKATNSESTFILDIGGRGYRHHKLRRHNIWCVHPHLVPGPKLFDFHSPTSCKHTIDKICLCRNFHSALLTHTLYHVTFPQLYEILSSVITGKAMAIVSLFPDMFGQIGEASYSRHGSMVTFSLAGEPSVRHSALDWLFVGFWKDGDKTIKSSRICRTQLSEIYLLEITTDKLEVPTMEVGKAVADLAYVGEINCTLADIENNEYQEVIFNTTTWNSIFGWAYATVGQEIYPIHKQLYSELAIYMVGKPRTRHTKVLLDTKAKNLISRYKFPVEHKLSIMVATVHAAFFYSMDKEQKLLQNGLVHDNGSMAVYNELLEFKFVKPEATIMQHLVKLLRNFSIITYGMCEATRLTLTLAQTLDINKMKTLVNNITGSRLLLTTGPQNEHGYVQSHAIGITYASSTLPLLDAQIELDWQNCNPNSVSFTYMHDIKEITGKIENLGIAVDKHYPIAYASTAHNELISAVNRAARIKTPLNRSVFAEFKQWVDDNFDDLFPNHQEYELVEDFNEWNSRYPLVKQGLHVKARANLPVSVSSYANRFRFKAFVKTEKLLLAAFDEVQYKDPRMIQGCQDEYNVIIGPPILAMQNKIKAIWNQESDIFYTCGSTAEQIGDWFTESTHYLENDFSRFDGSIHVELLKFEMHIYQRLGMRRSILAVMNQNLNAPAHTPHGVTFKVKGTRRSGTQNTSSGNSVINALTHAFMLSKNPVIVYRMAVLGDDNLVTMNYHEDELHLNFDIFTQLGLKATPKLVLAGQEHLLEFCSSRFYPLDVGGRQMRYILGPKIGRTMAKLSWFIRPPTDDIERDTMLRATILSRYGDFSYLPILRVVAERLLALTRINGHDVQVQRVTHKLLAAELHQMTPHVMLSVCQQYGITEEQVHDIERMIDSIVSLPAIINHPILDAMVEIDK